MMSQFSASQIVELTVPKQPIPVQHYLRQPHRLVQALTDPSRIEIHQANHFRLKMRPLSFMDLTLQPMVDLKVWSQPDGTVYLQSTGCEIRGVDYINQRFKLDLQGQLTPLPVADGVVLQGRADLTVTVDIPFPLQLTPEPILKVAGDSLLKSVLLTIKQRLVHQLVQDYCRWACLEAEISLTSATKPARSLI